VHASYARPSFFKTIADGLRDLANEEVKQNAAGTYDAARAISLFHEGATQPVEFLARRYVQLKDILIGSPLCIALA
jgi:hypothetical protein